MRKQALCTDVIYIKSFSTMMNNTKINITGILCIVFYNYLSLIRYYSKLVKLGANISQFQMKSLFLFLKKLNKTYNFVFIICLFFLSFGTFLYLCRTTLFLTSWNKWLTMHQKFTWQISKTYEVEWISYCWRLRNSLYYWTLFFLRSISWL